MKLTNEILLLFFLILLNSTTIHGQVTIGSVEKPADGAILDLKQSTTTTKGLGLPRVKLSELTKLKMGDNEILDTDNGGSQYAKHAGLLVYNVNEDSCSTPKLFKGLYVWNGTTWQDLNGQKRELSSDVYEITDDRDGEVYLALNFGSAGDWMLENLRYNPRMDERTDFTETSTANSSPYTDKYFYYAIGSDYTPAPANSPSHPTNWDKYKKNGIFYNWAAATNNENTSTADQGNTDHASIRGICPSGWHLPSDKEFNTLEKVIYESTDEYTNAPVPNSPLTWLPAYDTQEGYLPEGSVHGKSMKSACPPVGSSAATGGDSKLADAGGFNILLAGFAFKSSVGNYGSNGYLWSSSSKSSSNVWNRVVYAGESPMGRYRGLSRNYLFSVRCKKD